MTQSRTSDYSEVLQNVNYSSRLRRLNAMTVITVPITPTPAIKGRNVIGLTVSPVIGKAELGGKG